MTGFWTLQYSHTLMPCGGPIQLIILRVSTMPNYLHSTVAVGTQVQSSSCLYSELGRGGEQYYWWCPQLGSSPVIRHAQVCEAVGTLVVPCWPSASFWPLLCPGNSQFAPFAINFWDPPQVEIVSVSLLLKEVIFFPGSSFLGERNRQGR